ncbi:MAG: hypothetical protein HQL79_07600 [Magnetococcales bacterium]|nr:hypothetical protein [Magnetococcales bacterium]
MGKIVKKERRLQLQCPDPECDRKVPYVLMEAVCKVWFYKDAKGKLRCDMAPELTEPDAARCPACQGLSVIGGYVREEI